MQRPSFSEARGSDMAYLHASEWDDTARGLLRTAWDLSEEKISRDTTASECASAPSVDLHFARLRACTFSHRNHSVDRAASIAAGGQASGDVIGFLKTARARGAVMENVCEPDGVATIDTILTRESTAYKWSSQCISVKEHAGVPMGRIRHFWPGLRKPGVVLTVA